MKTDLKKWGLTLIKIGVTFTLGYSSNTIVHTYVNPPPVLEIDDPRFIEDPNREGAYMKVSKAFLDSLIAAGEQEEEDGMEIDKKRGGLRK